VDADRVPALGSVPSDAERLERLYRDHADRVFGLCLRMTGDRQRAAELVQDVFVRVWRKLHLLRGDDAGAWVWRVATNVVFNDTRSRRRRDARLVYEEDLGAVEARALPPSLATPPAVRRMDLSAAIARLPDRARAIYLLHDVEGFSTEEIADRLGIAGGTVRAQLHRARHALRRMLLP
jgi:RNA polymerase sigma-70 factor, ECF subfamily